MTTSTASVTFVYDGDCAFCGACARFIARHVPTKARVEAWQFIDLDALGLTVAQCDEAVQWVAIDASGRRTTASGYTAIAALLRSSSTVWRGLGRVLGGRLAMVLAAPVYSWVARNRGRLPGGTAACGRTPVAVRQPSTPAATRGRRGGHGRRRCG